MLRGDISNQRSFAFGFRCENSLLQLKTEGIANKFSNFLFGKIQRAEVNEDLLSLMKYIYWNTEYTVLLVIDDENYTKETEEYLSSFPFNQVVNVKSPSQIAMMLNTGEMSYYIDDYDPSRYAVQSKYAVTSQTFNTLLSRHYDRF